MADSFTISQYMTLRELVQASLYIGLRSKIIKRYFLFFSVLALACVVFGFITAGRYFYWQSILQILIPFVVMAALFFIFIVVVNALILLIKPDNFRNVVYQFTQWGMTRSAKGFDSSRPWGDFIKFRETASFFFLYISANDAHIIQKRMIGDEEEIEEFRNLIKDKVCNWMLNL
ncbi:MAG TPA: YcxB family protein [Puia sp.]|nr:YcxB family protein [Puia sp.]